MRFVLTAVVLALIAVAVALTVIYTGAYNVAATDPHLPVVRWALDTTFKNSVRWRAADIAVPERTPEMVEQGAKHYAAMCAMCHGTPGAALPEMAQHMRPHPPHLSDAAKEWAPNELFWIVKHGVKMTGMPAWGPSHSEEALWSIVAFVERMPGMGGEKYAALTKAEEKAKPAKKPAGKEPSPRDGNVAATVEMTGKLNFSPSSITIKVGDTVEWVNVSQVQHTVTADPQKANDPKHVALPEKAEPFDSGFIAPEGRYTHRFTVPGRYRYFCTPHEAAGMIGEVLVEE